MLSGAACVNDKPFTGDITCGIPGKKGHGLRIYQGLSR